MSLQLAGDKLVASATSKELVRTVLYKIGILSAVQRLLGKKKPYLEPDNLTDRFESIYRTGVWQLGDKSVPLSGEGSSIAATENLRSRLPELLHSIGAKRLLDVGCGDFTWMSQVNLSGINYVGAEIVPSVVQKSQQIYAAPGRAFIVANAVSDPLPSADAVLCREVLFHLSLEDGQKVLQNVLRTGATHFLLTTDIVTRVNSDIRSGDYRVLNLCAAPFKLPEPSVFIAEDACLSGRRLGVWTADELAKSLAQ